MGASHSRAQAQPAAAPTASTSPAKDSSSAKQLWPFHEGVRTLRDGSTVVVVPPRLDVSPFSVPFLLNASSLMLVAGGVFSAVEASKNRAKAPAASAAAAPRAGRLLDRVGWLALGAGCAGIAFAATNSTTARDNVRRTMRLTTGIDYLHVLVDAENSGKRQK